MMKINLGNKLYPYGQYWKLYYRVHKVKNSNSTPYIIEEESPFLHRITTTASSLGNSETHDAHKGDLMGLFKIVKTVEGLCQYHKVEKGKITIASNDLNAIKKSMD
eukprot:2730945-Ditylum_brightwellii.AAC.1